MPIPPKYRPLARRYYEKFGYDYLDEIFVGDGLVILVKEGAAFVIGESLETKIENRGVTLLFKKKGTYSSWHFDTKTQH